MTGPATVAASRRRQAALALVVGVAHFAATFMALRALLTAAAAGGGRSPALHAAVALLAFPLFYTPVPALFGGRSHTGVYVAALNALLWGAVALAVLRWRAGRRR